MSLNLFPSFINYNMLRKRSVNFIVGKMSGSAMLHSRYIILLYTCIVDGNAENLVQGQ